MLRWRGRNCIAARDGSGKPRAAKICETAVTLLQQASPRAKNFSVVTAAGEIKREKK